jgi:hypothetical protein
MAARTRQSEGMTSGDTSAAMDGIQSSSSKTSHARQRKKSTAKIYINSGKERQKMDPPNENVR